MDEDVAVDAFDEAVDDVAALMAAYEVSARAVNRSLPSGGTVVDVGCGPGGFLLHLAKRRPDARIIGLDLSQPMVELARERARRASLDGRVTIEVGDATELGDLPGDVAVVTCLNLLHQLPDVPTLDRCLRSIAEVRARSGSALWLLDLIRLRDRRTMPALLDIFEPGMTPEARRNTLESEAAAFTVAELRDRLAATGLSDLESRTAAGILPWQSHATRPRSRRHGPPGTWVGGHLPPAVRFQLPTYLPLIPST